MGFGDILKVKKAAEDIVSDPETKAALNILIKEASKELDSARKNPELRSGSLKEAFNTAAKLIPISQDFVNTKRIPTLKLLGMKKELENMGERFERAYKENDPVVLGVLNAVARNPTIQEAAVRLAAANEEAFKLEAGANGGGSLKLSILPGQTITVPIEPEYFAQAQDVVAKARAKKNPPRFGI